MEVPLYSYIVNNCAFNVLSLACWISCINLYVYKYYSELIHVSVHSFAKRLTEHSCWTFIVRRVTLGKQVAFYCLGALLNGWVFSYSFWHHSKLLSLGKVLFAYEIVMEKMSCAWMQPLVLSSNSFACMVYVLRIHVWCRCQNIQHVYLKHCSNMCTSCVMQCAWRVEACINPQTI